MNCNVWYPQSELEKLLKICDDEIRNYKQLLTIQSLTQGLESLNASFSVKLLYLGEQKNNSFHADVIFTRQVHLCLNNAPVVWAESICDVKSMFWRDYLNCGTQALGRKLFDHGNKIYRSPFKYRLFTPDQLPLALVGQNCQTIIARSSDFMFENEQLCLTEYFLPSLSAFI